MKIDNRVVKEFNINDTVYVMLTDRGKSILREEAPGQFKGGWFNSVVEGGFYRMSMWEFMNIFGKHYYCGDIGTITENNKIYVEY
jgi:hypothetical protein